MESFSFAKLPANVLTAGEMQKVIEYLRKYSHQAKMSSLFARAVADWARSIEEEYTQAGKHISHKDAQKFIDFLPIDVKNATVAVFITSAGNVNIGMELKDKVFDYNQSYTYYPNGYLEHWYNNRISRLYQHETKHRIASFWEKHEEAEKALANIGKHLKTYNKAAKKVQEAKELLATINAEISPDLGLMDEYLNLLH